MGELLGLSAEVDLLIDPSFRSSIHDVRFTPKSGHVQCNDHVRFGPKADISRYSITSSARARTDGVIMRSSALAVLRLTTSSYLVGACTGISLGFSPLRIRSTYSAARRNGSIRFGP